LVDELIRAMIDCYVNTIKLSNLDNYQLFQCTPKKFTV
jgi:hypothetical protein